MIIDTPAIIAIRRDEPEAISCARAIADAMTRRVSAVYFVEAAVAPRFDASRNPIATRRFDEFIREANISNPSRKFKRGLPETPTETSEKAVGIRRS
jgi:ribonuclease VapC